MAPKRPQSHVNAEICINRLRDAFLSVGWTVEELDKDYGEDLQVRIFDDGEATPYMFFVQAKHLAPTTRRRGRTERHVPYPFPAPLADLARLLGAGRTRTLGHVHRHTDWEIAQSITLPTSDTRRCTVRFSTRNLMGRRWLGRIRSRTIARFKRLETEQRGAQVLIDRLHELFDIEIDYDPHGGRLGIELPNGDTDMTFFGRTAEQLEARIRSADLLDFPPRPSRPATSTWRCSVGLPT